MATFVPKDLKETADASRGQRSFKEHLKFVVSVAVMLLVIYLALGLIADLTAAFIPDRWEVRLFGDMTELFDEATPAPKRVKQVFDKLSANTELRQLNYRLIQLEDEDPNAFAIPGGAIGVTSGLLEVVKSEQGLAFVIAHEMGHHQERHTLKRLGRTLLYAMLMVVLQSSGGPSSSVVDMAGTLSTASYSRGQEEEADTFGIELLLKSYGRADDALEFFEWVHGERGDKESPFSEFLSTHPLTEDRLARLRQLTGS